MTRAARPWRIQEAVLVHSEAALAEAEAQILSGEREMAAGREALAQLQAQIESGRAELESGRQTLQEGEEALAQARQELEDGEEEIAQAKADYAEAEQEAEDQISDARAEIDDAQQEVEEIEMPEWYVLDRQSVQSYVEYDNDADRIGAIGTVFPVIFFLVAALVSLTTMTRMVEEKRTEIGTMKALGYSTISIASKYMPLRAVRQSDRKCSGISGGRKAASLDHHHYLQDPVLQSEYDPGPL